MPELRFDPITRRWVIIATERAKRPSDFGGHSPTAGSEVESTDFHPDCPFCEGNEAKTPPEVLAFRKPGTKPNEPGWWVRVFPDISPLVSTNTPINKRGYGIYDEISGYGYHEIVAETPKHLADLSDLDDGHVYEVLWAYKERMIKIKTTDPNIKQFIIVRNFGVEAGERFVIRHSHSHIIGLPIITKRINDELIGSSIFYRFHERCIFCDIITNELESKERIVLESDHFVVISFYAARVPFELHILPKRHNPFYETSTEEELRDLAKVIRTTLIKLKKVVNPAYNMILHTAPYYSPNPVYPVEEIYHWHIEIMPRLTKAAGFEWGTGFHINPVPPEKAALYLAEA